MNSCKVLFFASMKERTGIRQTALELPDGITVRGFKLILKDKFPILATQLPSALIAVNREYALDDVVIPPDAEIAIFPPVSGGTSPVS